MTNNSIDLHKQYIGEILSGDNTHAEQFAEICVVLTKKIAYCCNFSFDKDETIDDFCHDIYLHVFKNLDKYKAEFAFSTWLSTVVRNYYYRKYNDKAKGLKVFSIDSNANKDDLDQYQKIVGGESAEKNYLNGITIAWEKLYKAMAGMNPNYSAAVTLVYLNKKSVNEAAVLLDATPSQVNNWLARGRAKLLEFCLNEGIQEDLYEELGR